MDNTNKQRRMDPGEVRDLQLATLHGIARAAIMDLPLDRFLDRVVTEIRSRFGWEYVGIAWTERGEAVLAAFSTDLPCELSVGHRQPLDSGIVGRVASSGAGHFESATQRSTEYVPTVPDVCAELCLPILHEGEVVGVLNAETSASESLLGQTEFLETVCGLVAAAHSTSVERERLRRQADLVEVANAVSRLAMHGERLEDMLRLTVDFIADRLDVCGASILILNEEGTHFSYEVCAGELELRTPENWPITLGAAGRCVRMGQSQLVTDTHYDRDYFPGHEDIRSEFLVPIAWRERVLGVLNLESVDPETFTPEFQRVFKGIADQVAGLIHLLSVRSDLEASNRRLERLSRVDGLTGVANRREFDAVLEGIWRMPDTLCVAMVDVDRFKALNDHHGHLYGDDCLVRLARTIEDTVGDRAAVVARYGGEEFSLVLPRMALRAAIALMERVRARIAGLALDHLGGGESRCVTVSIGVAERQPGDEAPDALVQRADEVLYLAKERGRDRVEPGPEAGR